MAKTKEKTTAKKQDNTPKEATLYFFYTQGCGWCKKVDPIVDEFTFLELAGKLVGFSPARYTYANELNRARKNLDRSLNKKKSTLTKQLYKFTTAGDFEAVNEVRKKIVQFNLKHPEVAITPESIERSMKRHQRTSAEMQAGTYITPRNNEYINMMLRDMN